MSMFGIEKKESNNKVELISDIDQLADNLNLVETSNLKALKFKEQPFVFDFKAFSDTKKEVNDSANRLSLNQESFIVDKIFLSNLSLFFYDFEVSIKSRYALNKNCQEIILAEKSKVLKSILKVYTSWLYSSESSPCYEELDQKIVQEILKSFENGLETALHLLLWEDFFFSDSKNEPDNEELDKNQLSRRYSYLSKTIFEVVNKEHLYFSQSRMFDSKAWKKLILGLPVYDDIVISHIKDIINSLKVSYLNNNSYLTGKLKLSGFMAVIQIMEFTVSKSTDILVHEKIIRLYIMLIEVSESLYELIKPLNNSIINIFRQAGRSLKTFFFDLLKLNFNSIKDQPKSDSIQNINAITYKARIIPFANYCLYADPSAICYLADIMRKETSDDAKALIIDILFNKIKIQNYIQIRHFVGLINISCEKCHLLIHYICMSDLILPSKLDSKPDTPSDPCNIDDYEFIREEEEKINLKKQIFSYMEKNPDKLSYLIEALGFRITMRDFFEWFFPLLKYTKVFANQSFIASCRRLFTNINSNYEKSLLSSKADEFSCKKGIINLIYNHIILNSKSKTFNDDNLILWSQYLGQDDISFTKSVGKLLTTLRSKLLPDLFISLYGFFYDNTRTSLFSEILYEFIIEKHEEIYKNENLFNSIVYITTELGNKFKKYSSKLPENIKKKLKDTKIKM